MNGRIKFLLSIPGDVVGYADVPLLKEFKNPFGSQPKISLFEGMEGCRRAYSLLLDSKTEVLEFAPHDDLVKMGEEFMNRFMDERARRGVFIKPICPRSTLHEGYKKRDREQKRQIKMFEPSEGRIYSSITIFEDKVLLLNLHQDAFAVLIENKEVSETLKTIHHMVWRSL